MQEMAATACMSSYSLARLLPLSRFGNQHIFKLAEASMLLGLPRRAVEVLPATITATQRVAALQAKLADTATLRELFADVEDEFTSFVP